MLVSFKAFKWSILKGTNKRKQTQLIWIPTGKKQSSLLYVQAQPKSWRTDYNLRQINLAGRRSETCTTRISGFQLKCQPVFRNFHLPRCWSGERLSCAQIYWSCCICPKEEVRSEICRWLPGWSPNWMRNTTEYPDRQTSTRACYQRNLLQEPWCSSKSVFPLRSWCNLHRGWVHRGWQLCPVLLALKIQK